MQISDYSKKAITTMTDDHEFGDTSARLLSFVLGLGGESGEVLEKFKKILREKKGKISDADKDEIIKELGDVLWYTNAVAHLLGSSLEEVAARNNAKLASRKTRGKLFGDGDNR